MNEAGGQKSLSFPKTLQVALGAFALLWVLSGIYVIKADEMGVVRRFGKIMPVGSQPGIHYHLPYPVETVAKPRVTEVKSLKVGADTSWEQQRDLPDLKKIKSEIVDAYEGDSNIRQGFFAKPIESEQSEFLTGDENIIHAQLILQWSISNPIAYLSIGKDVEQLLSGLAESTFTKLIGSVSVDEALTSQKAQILNQFRRNIQDKIDAMGLGVGVVAVDLVQLKPPKNVEEAFKEVASAKGDAARLIHEAEGYQNESLPKARSESNAAIASAQAYFDQVVHKAIGDSQRFVLILTEYKRNPAQTRKRLYMEAMDTVLPRMKKYFMATKGGEKATKITLFMDELTGKRKKEPAAKAK